MGDHIDDRIADADDVDRSLGHGRARTWAGNEDRGLYPRFPSRQAQPPNNANAQDLEEVMRTKIGVRAGAEPGAEASATKAQSMHRYEMLTAFATKASAVAGHAIAVTSRRDHTRGGCPAVGGAPVGWTRGCDRVVASGWSSPSCSPDRSGAGETVLVFPRNSGQSGPVVERCLMLVHPLKLKWKFIACSKLKDNESSKADAALKIRRLSASAASWNGCLYS